jgi:hypothetical protein
MSIVNWDRIISDPAYVDLPAAEQQKVQKAYLETQKAKALAKKSAPAKPTPKAQPKPAVKPAPKRAPVRPAPPEPANPLARAGSALASGFKQGYDSGLTGAVTNKLGITQKGEELLNPVDAFQGLMMNLNSTEGAGEGMASAVGSTAASLLDPLGLAVDAATLGAGGKLARVAAPVLAQAPKVAAAATKAAPHVAGAVSGTVQGGATAALNGEATAAGVTNALLGGVVTGAMGLRGRGANPAPAAAAPTKVPPVAPPMATVPAAARGLSPTAAAKLGARPGALGFDPNKDLQRRIKGLEQQERRARELGRVDEADRLASQIESMRDVRTMTDSRPELQGEPWEVVASNHFNFGRVNVDTEEASVLQRLVQETVKERGFDPKQRITFDDIRAEAADVAPELVDQLKPPKDGQTLHPVMRYAARERLNAINAEIVNQQRELTKNLTTMTQLERSAAEAKLSVLERNAKGLLDVLLPTRSQDGRNLAFHQMMAEKSFDAEYWLARANRVTGGATTDDQMNRIRQLLVDGNQAEAAGDAVRVRQARIDLAGELAKLERSGHLEVLAALRKAGLLTGVKTIQRNMLGTMAYNALEEVVKVPAAIIDLGLSLATGNRTVLMPTPGKAAAGVGDAVTKGFREFGETMRHGATRDQLANLEIPREVNPAFGGVAQSARLPDRIPLVGGKNANDLLGSYINTVFRFQSAQDRITKAYAYRRSLEDQARLKVRNDRALPAGTDKEALVRQYVEHPTTEMVAEAIADADFMTFTNDTNMATAVQAFKGQLSPGKRFFSELVLPFVKTPSAVASRVLEYALIGQVGQLRNAGELHRVINGSLTPAEQKTIAMGMSRGMVGSSLIYLGFKLAEAGLMTGTYQPERKEINEAAGRTPSSIKMAGQWVPIQPLSPIGNLLTIGATLQRDGLTFDSATTIGLKTVLDQPMTQGASQLVDIAKDPSKNLDKFQASLWGSLVPTLSSEVAAAFDDTTRARAKEMPEAGLDAMQAKVPGLRNQLPPKVTPLGDEVRNPSGGWAFNAFSGRPAVEDTDPVIKTLVQLSQLQGENGPALRLPSTPKVIRYRGHVLELTDDEQRELAVQVGQMTREMLAPIVNDPGFQAQEDQDERLEAVHMVLTRAMKVAKLRMIQANRTRLRRPGAPQ